MKDSQFTPTERRLLDRLKAGEGKLVNHYQLLRSIGRYTRLGLPMLRQYISRLRKKIEVDPALPNIIITHRGRGYSYEEDFEEFIMRETEAAIEGGIIDDETGLPFE